MPRVLARRRAGGDDNAETGNGNGRGSLLEEIEWVEWPDEPRHELLFDVPEPGAADHGGQQQQQPTLAARAYAAVFESGGERFTLFHRHRHDTAYICASAAADDAAGAEVWNEELRALAPPPPPPEGPCPSGPGEEWAAAPTHELLPPSRVHHATGMCFCNPHATRNGGAYIHRIRYAARNTRTLHFVGVEVRPRPSAPASGGGAAAGGQPPLPLVAAPHLSLKLEYEQPGLFRAWRLAMVGGSGAAGGGAAATAAATAGAVALGAGFAGRGGAVVLIKPADWSKLVYECGDGGGASAGPFGETARARSRGAGGWSGAPGGGGGSGGGVFPAGAAWPLSPEDGRAPFSLAPKDAVEGAVLEAMLVEFL